MMRRFWLAGIVLATLTAISAQAQTPDSTVPDLRGPIRRKIEQGLADRVKVQLGLNDEQMTKLRATTGKFGGQRRDLEKRQLDLRRALASQLRPGVAANKDSVARLTDELLAGRVKYAQTFQAELAELKTYLDPVQRAQLMAMRERLLRAAQQFRERQGMGEGLRGRRRPFMER
jgi:hypothetical protein